MTLKPSNSSVIASASLTTARSFSPANQAIAFPYVFVLRGPEIRRDIFVASDSPIRVDPTILTKRFDQINDNTYDRVRNNAWRPISERLLGTAASEMLRSTRNSLIVTYFLEMSTAVGKEGRF